MSLQTIIPMFVTCMAPLFLVYFVVGGIYTLQLDKTTCVSGTSDFDATAEYKSYIALCVAFVVACAVLSIYTAMFGGRKGAGEEHARRKTVFKHVGQRDEGGMGWFDIDWLKDNMEVGEEDEMQFHSFDVDDGVSDISHDSGSREDNIEKESLGSASGLG